MKVSTENDNNFGYEKITIVVDNIPLKQNETGIPLKETDQTDSSIRNVTYIVLI